MLEYLYGIGTMTVATAIFMVVRKLILNKAKKTVEIGTLGIVKKPSDTNCYIGKTYKINKDGTRVEVTPTESFNFKKFLSGLNLFDGKVWAKSVVYLIRHLLIVSIIVASIYGYGWWRGRSNAPVEWQFNYESEFTLQIPKGTTAIFKPQNSSYAYWIDKNGNKTVVKVKDIPELQKYLKPIGLEVVPIAVGGFGVGESGSGFEAGVGVSLVRFWKMRLEPFITQRGVYVGTSYKITQNSGLGLGAGKGWKGDNRVMFYWRMEF